MKDVSGFIGHVFFWETSGQKCPVGGGVTLLLCGMVERVVALDEVLEQ